MLLLDSVYPHGLCVFAFEKGSSLEDVLYEGDGSIFAQALAKHLAPRTEAYVANHHNPRRCEARPRHLS